MENKNSPVKDLDGKPAHRKQGKPYFKRKRAPQPTEPVSTAPENSANSEASAKVAEPTKRIGSIDGHAEKRKKQRQSENGGGKETQSIAPPKKTAKKGKKATKPAVKDDVTGVIPIPDLLPRKEERPAEPETRFDSNDILTRKYKRPEKKVIPSLAEVSLLPTIELKETFGNLRESLSFHQPVKSLPDSDATTRMFAQKKQIPERFRPAESTAPAEKESDTKEQKRFSKGNGKGKNYKKNGNQPKTQELPAPVEATPAQNAPAPAQSQQKGNAKQSVTTPPAHSHKKKKLHPTPSKPKHANAGAKHTPKTAPTATAPAQETPKANKHVLFTIANDATPNSKAKEPRPQKSALPKQHVLRIPARMEKPSRQKDSTEQESLMKPYYLTDFKR